MSRLSAAERALQLTTVCCGLLVAAMLVLMLVLAWPLLHSGQLLSLIGGDWQPAAGRYGIAPMLAASLLLAISAVLLAIPLSLGTAFAAVALAPPLLRSPLMLCVRLMAGIPTVIYGFAAVFALVPLMRQWIGSGSGFTLLTATLVLAVLIAPTMIVFFVGGLRAVPQGYSLAADALGCRPVDKLLYLLLPQAAPAITAGIVMGLGRALGDTMIGLMLAGNSAIMPDSMFSTGRTLTSHIALVIAADFSSMEFKSIFACGIVLYLLTAALVAILRRVLPLPATARP